MNSSTFLKNLLANAEATAYSGGSFTLFQGAKPASADLPPAGSTPLVVFTLTTFTGSVNGAVNVISAQTAIVNTTGVAQWGRFADVNGNTLSDVLVGESGPNIDVALSPTSLVAGGLLTVTSLLLEVIG